MQDRMINILQPFIDARIKRFYHATKHPIERQQYILKSLLEKAQETEIGRNKCFYEIKDHAEFGRRLEISDYNSYQSYIERIIKGERDVLWPGKIDWFAKSSGTSGISVKIVNLFSGTLYTMGFTFTTFFITFLRQGQSSISA